MKTSARFIAVLFSSMLLVSCFHSRNQEFNIPKRKVPRDIAVLPPGNKTADVTAPLLLRYFLEKELKSKGFRITMRASSVDQELRQLGITDGNQINSSNLQYLGQSLRVDGVVQSNLIDFHQDIRLSVTVIKAEFRFVSTQTGQIFWEEETTVQESGLRKVPVRSNMTDLSLQSIDAVAKSVVGKLPHKLVKDALKSLKK